jgi:hypothetical protein
VSPSFPKRGATALPTMRKADVIHEAIVAVVEKSFWMARTPGMTIVST